MINAISKSHSRLQSWFTRNTIKRGQIGKFHDVGIAIKVASWNAQAVKNKIDRLMLATDRIS